MGKGKWNLKPYSSPGRVLPSSHWHYCHHHQDIRGCWNPYNMPTEEKLTFHQPKQCGRDAFTSWVRWNRWACSFHSPKKFGGDSTSSQVLSAVDSWPLQATKQYDSSIDSLLQVVPHLFKEETLLDVSFQRSMRIFPDKSALLQKIDTWEALLF